MPACHSQIECARPAARGYDRADVRNLFIVDGSVVVTAAGVNRTSTIQAQALYVVDSIRQRLAILFDQKAAMASSDLIAGETALIANEREALRALVALIIPASAQYGVPGADDATIFADILASARPYAAEVSSALSRLDTLAEAPFASLDGARQQRAADLYRSAPTPALGLIVTLTAQCYYRDDRVMQSLEMEARPPFPKGYDLESGDWSLLDVVRKRPKFYRQVP